MEHLREVRVEISTDTTKRSTHHVYDLESYDSLADLISAVHEALEALEASL